MSNLVYPLCLVMVFIFSSCQQESVEPAEPMPATAQADAPPAPGGMEIAPPSPEHAEEVNNMVPSDWSVRLDRADPDAIVGDDPEASDIYFVNMSPGWHVTTGPSAIFYHQGNKGTGAYQVKSTIHLFDPGDRREGYGIYIGGNNLDGDDQSYDYFLLRNSGEYLIKRRTGSETSTIRDWTPHDSIVKYENTEEASIANTLEIAVSEENVTFMINGQEVEQLPAGEIATEGLVGLRINHALNVHVTEISVTPTM